MLSSGIHESLDQPPTCSMFKCAGNSDSSRRRPDSFSEALTSSAVAISSALSPNNRAPVSQAKTSPAKHIESRSKFYKQLNELSNLKANGIITEDEYSGSSVIRTPLFQAFGKSIRITEFVRITE